MRVSTSKKLAVYVLDKSGLIELLYDFYPSISDAVQAAKQHLSKKRRKAGKYQLVIWQGGKFWKRIIEL